jgi:tryptophan synthase alpha chain
MGVTGVRNKLDSTIKEKVNRIRCVTDLPIIVGFGISNPNQARDVALYADGVIVGSAVVNLIEKYKDTSEMLLKVGEFIKKLKQGIESRF